MKKIYLIFSMNGYSNNEYHWMELDNIYNIIQLERFLTAIQSVILNKKYNIRLDPEKIQSFSF
ncbi:hypothetical protein J2Z64_003417 [Oceanobacillus polygoni]|uniref:Uncharacterized protein n=1 Tax=Oceanobacillus polygoni TaxID=1235259 RepID=A0A9X0YW69_9BACI|nr:hypothetical protein [Oceanobacillus polygoni]